MVSFEDCAMDMPCVQHKLEKNRSLEMSRV